ncbi:hypothetical protein CPC735_048720 [Coccidioides posadasii C735 delta SOWgp]|uniref:Mitochondrial import inner membrane translocase subunit TIM54 n=2 Tax=Coccidioides posadasii TaxID=199306 RepID=A0A0J6I0U3_COCPO|nr:hypothetical protein CPC735_048720 [Coccidioides posadasii C735 delta SOWgp]EER23502.1 hypothetical protein CPC735_048720 [Coccidioides posadasii C735 delta SOWgp]KMM64882.1 mitochondrial import inner membrane translocase subunit tim54 [Coccidioides posadasii RMSCC 3488]|eukprot:XP_003065647.1 hypothetical protein CPC735_048720 [Coccidioides posadasii C735 delta SOWgp]
MADSSTPSTPPPQNGAPKAAPKPQNPALRMLGLPNLRLKLPSRNWMIFLTVTGSFFGALIYDRREKKRVQEKWSNLVAHIAKEPIPTNETRRKLTIFLAAPPGDGLMSARDHFREYVKPILVSGAMDYEVIEGRREGDIRAALAKKIRKFRQTAGEGPPLEEDDHETSMRRVRELFGTHDEPGVKGDVVIGRHTWKEYVRGLHEGWLGPVNPIVAEPEFVPPTTEKVAETEPNSQTTDDGSNTAEVDKKDEKEKEEKKPEAKKPKGPTLTYLLPSLYSSQELPPSLPDEFQPSSPLAFPHILGFLNTPIRIKRFLTRRYLADSVGRDVAAIVLASSYRPYSDNYQSTSLESTDSDSPTSSSSLSYEQQHVLEQEEKEWHKSVHKTPENPDLKEREWLDDVVIDPRIGARMRRFTLSPEEEERAQRIAEGKEWVLGEEKPVPIPTWTKLWNKYGWGEDDTRGKPY